MTSAHVALVLAAGGSTRLGQPKQLLTRGGEPLVRRAVRLALETVPRQVMVVLGSGSTAVADALRDLPCITIENPQWRDGLSSSLRSAAAHVTRAGMPVLVLGCDQPALEATHLRALLAAAFAAQLPCSATGYGDAPGVPAVVPHGWFDGSQSPSGDRGFRSRLEQLGTALPLVPAPAGLALDIDTPDDLAQARRHGWIDPRA